MQGRLSTDTGHRSRYEVTLGIETRNNLHEMSVLRHSTARPPHQIDAEFVPPAICSMRALGSVWKIFYRRGYDQRADKIRR
jgi:hypothetical protein